MSLGLEDVGADEYVKKYKRGRTAKLVRNLYVISVLASAGLFIGTSAISEFASRRAKSSSFQNRRAEWGHMKREQRELMRNSGKCLALLGFGYGCYRYGKRRELYEKTGD